MNTYNETHLCDVATELILKTQCRFASKAGAIIRDKKRAEWRKEFAIIENGLRLKLPQGKLPPRVADDSLLPIPKVDKAACSQRPSEVDEAPALKVDASGEVLQDLAWLARQAGLAVGSPCIAVKAARGIKRHRFGTVVSFGYKEPEVAFDAVDGVDGEVRTLFFFPLASLQAHHQPAAKRPKAQSSAAAPAEVSKTPGIEWQPCDDGCVEDATKHLLLALNAQLQLQRAPTPDDVTVLEDPRVLIALKPLPPLTLKLIPRAANLERLAASSVTGEEAGEKAPADIKVAFKGAADIFYKRVPIQATLGRQEGSSLVIDAAEFVLASAEAARAYSGGCVELVSVTSGDLEVPFCAYTTGDANFKPAKKASVIATLQYWTNACAVPAGAALARAAS